VRAFKGTPSLVKAIFDDKLGPLKHEWKHTALNEDYEQQIRQGIPQNAQNHTSIMRKEVKDYNASQFLTPITSDCVNSFVLRPEDKIIPTEGVENEEQRLQVPEIFFNRKV
jgi:hypothetical protein